MFVLDPIKISKAICLRSSNTFFDENQDYHRRDSFIDLSFSIDFDMKTHNYKWNHNSFSSFIGFHSMSYERSKLVQENYRWKAE